jgi:hypothetical protein
MNTTSEHIRLLQNAIEHPSRGVVGLVDDLLTVCWQNGLQLDWQANGCRVRSSSGEWEDLPALSLRKSAFRAVLARVAALCNEQSPGSVSPYGGLGELAVDANPSAVVEVALTNTPEDQRLELRPRTALPAARTGSLNRGRLE